MYSFSESDTSSTDFSLSRTLHNVENEFEDEQCVPSASCSAMGSSLSRALPDVENEFDAPTLPARRRKTPARRRVVQCQPTNGTGKIQPNEAREYVEVLGGLLYSPIEQRVPAKYMGAMDLRCPNCDAFYFRGKATQRAIYSHCCDCGRKSLPAISPVKSFLRELLEGRVHRHFRDNIRSHNSSLAFASFGAYIQVF